MIESNLKHAPYLSLRHARTGRVGDDGVLPSGWSGEHTGEITVLEVGASGDKPEVTIAFGFGADVASDFVGLCVGPYLPAGKDAVVAMAGEVSLAEWDNIAAAILVLREWREGGELVRQSIRPLGLRDAPQTGLVAHQIGGEGRVAQPLLLVKRRAPGAGSATVTLQGLAFGNLYDHPHWLWG